MRASSRILYCGHSTQHSHLVVLFVLFIFLFIILELQNYRLCFASVGYLSTKLSSCWKSPNVALGLSILVSFLSVLTNDHSHIYLIFANQSIILYFERYYWSSNQSFTVLYASRNDALAIDSWTMHFMHYAWAVPCRVYSYNIHVGA